MKILPLISPKFKSLPCNNSADNHYGLDIGNTSTDVFIKSIRQEPGLGNEIVKNVKADSKNTRGVSDNTFIIGDVNSFEKFYLVKENEVLCWMQMSDIGDCIQIDKLYSNFPNRHDGAGTELLKYAVEKSKELGYGGKISVCMAGSQPFYRKCNFKIGKSASDYDPALDAVFDFSARSKGKYSMGWSKRQTMFAFLDEKAAKALLKDKRIFLRPNSKIMGETTLRLSEDDKNAKIDGIIDFCDVGDGKYVVQFLRLDKEENCVFQSAYIMAQLVDDGGLGSLQVVDSKTFGVPFSCRNYEKEFNTMVYDELMRALETRARELGFDIK